MVNKNCHLSELDMEIWKSFVNLRALDRLSVPLQALVSRAKIPLNYFGIILKREPASALLSASESLTYVPTYLLTYLLTPWCRVLLEKLTGFTEPEGSLPHSQASVTCLYPGPTQSSPYTHIPPTGDPS